MGFDKAHESGDKTVFSKIRDIDIYNVDINKKPMQFQESFINNIDKIKYKAFRRTRQSIIS
jgi:hypothetical protein